MDTSQITPVVEVTGSTEVNDKLPQNVRTMETGHMWRTFVKVCVCIHKINSSMCLLLQISECMNTIAIPTIYIAVIDCEEPADMKNASISYNGTTFEETVNYSCEVGFRFPNGAKLLMRSCNASGNWTGPNGSCEG